MSKPNPYCDRLGIKVPRLEAAKQSAGANFYSLLIVALLEHGAPITLVEAANRFEEAGVAPADRALASLKRCKPGRPPIYRDGDLYALDPHDDETGLWVYRLGLRPPKSPPLQLVQPEPAPLPPLDQPLTVALLDEAWHGGITGACSAARVAICVLDAHDSAMSPAEVLGFVRARSNWSQLSADSAKYWRKGAAIRVREDGLWELDVEHEAVRSARRAIRERVQVQRRWAAARPDPAVAEAHRRRFERERAEHAEHLARMTRVLVHAFPARAPEALVLLDIASREILTFAGADLPRARAALECYDIIAAMNVRELLRGLGFDPGDRRLAELGPPQKTFQLNKRGRTLKITTRLLVQGSCGISRPFGEPHSLRRYLERGEQAKLCSRLIADAKSLFALYQYGRLHGTVRLRWGFLDERIPAPWVHRDEPTLYNLMSKSLELGVPLEVVAGGAPGWKTPWSRSELAYVRKEQGGWQMWLVDEQGRIIDEDDVQLMRIAERSR